MFGRHPDEDDRIATNAEALREYAYNYGMDHPALAWILTDWDVWMPNPHYHGQKVPHPEDDYAAEPPGFDDPPEHRPPEWTGFDSQELDDNPTEDDECPF